MILSIVTEPGIPATQHARTPPVPDEGALAGTFDELMAPPGAAAEEVADTVPIDIRAALPALPEASDPAPDQGGAEDAPLVAALIVPNVTKGSKSGAEVTLVAPQETVPGDAPSVTPPPEDRNAARDSAHHHGARGRELLTRAGITDPPRASVAQAVVEGRLPRPPLPDHVQSRIAAAGDAPPHSAALSATDRTKMPISVREAGLKPPDVPLPDQAPRQRRDAVLPTVVADEDGKVTARGSPAVPHPISAQAQLGGQPQVEILKETHRKLDAELTMSPASAERHVSTPGLQGTAPAATSPDTARHAAAQIAVAITSNPGKPTEIALNPEELGRVRLRLSATEGAITLHVMAERPETQDLLRRHMDVLAHEFRQLGYTSISFSFGEQKREPHSEAALPEELPELEAPDIPDTPASQPDQGRSGLDLRI